VITGACTLVASANQTNDSGKYTFTNYGGEVYTPEPMEFGANLNGNENATLENRTERKHMMLQFYANLNEEQKEVLEEYGVQLVLGAGTYSYIVSMPADYTAADLPAESGLRWMGEVPVEDKYDPALGLNVPNWARTEDGKVKIDIRFYEDVSSQEAQILAEKYSSSTPELVSSQFVLYGITTDENELISIVNEDAVQMITFPYTGDEPNPIETSSKDSKKASGFQFIFSILIVLCVLSHFRKVRR
jgi:hypothetical protein